MPTIPEMSDRKSCFNCKKFSTDSLALVLAFLFINCILSRRYKLKVGAGPSLLPRASLIFILRIPLVLALTTVPLI